MDRSRGNPPSSHFSGRRLMLKGQSQMNPQQPIPRVRIKPVHPFTPFRDEEIEQSIPERFEQQVRAYGHRLAIKSDEASLSFNDLNQTANKLARRIMSRRGKQAEPIALLFDHGAGVIAAMLGVLKAAKFYLVLDPTYPHDRLVQMLEDSGAQLIVADIQNLALARNLSHEATEIVNFNDPSENPSGVNVEISSARAVGNDSVHFGLDRKAEGSNAYP